MATTQRKLTTRLEMKAMMTNGDFVGATKANFERALAKRGFKQWGLILPCRAEDSAGPGAKLYQYRHVNMYKGFTVYAVFTAKGLVSRTLAD